MFLLETCPIFHRIHIGEHQMCHPHQLGFRVTKAAPVLPALRHKLNPPSKHQKSQSRGTSQPCAQMFNKLHVLFHCSSCNAIKALNPDALLDLHFAVDLNRREIFFFLYRSKSTWEKKSAKSNPHLKLSKLDFVQHLFNSILSWCLIRTTKAQ